MSKLKRCKRILQGLTTLVAFAASIAGLTAFLSLRTSIEQFDTQQTQRLADQQSQFNSRMSALGTELYLNFAVCSKLSTETKRSPMAFPSQRYSTDVLGSILPDGEIGDYALRNELVSYHHQVIIANRNIENTLLLHFAEGIKMSDPTWRQDVHFVVNRELGFIKENARSIRTILTKVLPLFYDYWCGHRLHDSSVSAPWLDAYPEFNSMLKEDRTQQDN